MVFEKADGLLAGEERREADGQGHQQYKLKFHKKENLLFRDTK
jgi:hypothetical protein